MRTSAMLAALVTMLLAPLGVSAAGSTVNAVIGTQTYAITTQSRSGPNLGTCIGNACSAVHLRSAGNGAYQFINDAPKRSADVSIQWAQGIQCGAPVVLSVGPNWQTLRATGGGFCNPYHATYPVAERVDVPASVVHGVQSYSVEQKRSTGQFLGSCAGTACAVTRISYQPGVGYAVSNRGKSTITVSIRWMRGLGCGTPAMIKLGANQSQIGRQSAGFCNPYRSN